MSSARIALVTCTPGPGAAADPDLPGLLAALAATGAEAVAVRWDDPGADWAAFDLAVIRSTWDYARRPAEFLAWVDRCGALTRLANPPAVLRWNADKQYLGELAARGVPVVPTRYLPPGSPAELPADHEYVIKPTTGAGARFAARHLPAERAQAVQHLAQLHAEGLTAMVQPYLRRIERSGERSLVFVAGRCVHAIRKNGVLAAGARFDAEKNPHPGVVPWTPSPAELAAGERVLAAVPGAPELLYARVDLVEDEDGAPLVMELEAIEPYLFLTLHQESLPVFARAIAAAASRGE
ncbi:ATP-grasp domain-containing protein [Kitasatospora sp. LaBMicrA B282]|uniref:ATP-grasp domain-containing protein n=1 Tax=Kitasatospora sp. LaBMicrA B282 TaxID=3420949 RepID=UPI003D141E5E